MAIHDKDYLNLGEALGPRKASDSSQAMPIGFPLGKVVLVTAARYFNYIFNPISFFYCHDLEGRLVCVVAQVSNTFGEMHLYLLDANGAEIVDGRMQFLADKQFHVSPFFPRQGHYEFRLTKPGENVSTIPSSYHVNDQLVAGCPYSRPGPAIDPSHLARTIFTHPICASLTMPRILWQAAKLHWQRRLPVFINLFPVAP